MAWENKSEKNKNSKTLKRNETQTSSFAAEQKNQLASADHFPVGFELPSRAIVLSFVKW
jgi:hypothetical protein